MPDLPPGTPRVGIIGGGQLARMSQQPAIALGIQLHVLADSEHDSASQVIPAMAVAGFDTGRGIPFHVKTRPSRVAARKVLASRASMSTTSTRPATLATE